MRSRLALAILGASIAALAVASSSCASVRPSFTSMRPPIVVDGDGRAMRARAARLVDQILSRSWIYAGRPDLAYANTREARFSFDEIVRTGPLSERITTYRTLSWSEVRHTQIRRHPDPLVVAYVVEVHVEPATGGGADRYDWYTPNEKAAYKLAWAVEYLAGNLPYPGSEQPETAEPAPRPPDRHVPGCHSAAQCKGDRVCVQGRCTSPRPRHSCNKDLDCPGELVCNARTCTQPSR